MKCIKNIKTGNIIRVADNVANNMVGNTWQFISKSEWRKSQGLVEKEKVSVSHDLGGPVETPVNKKSKKIKKN